MKEHTKNWPSCKVPSTLLSRLGNQFCETWAWDNAWWQSEEDQSCSQLTQDDQPYGRIRHNNSLLSYPTACLDTAAHPALSQGQSLATLAAVSAKIGSKIMTRDRLQMTDIMGCFDMTITFQSNQTYVWKPISILQGAKDQV